MGRYRKIEVSTWGDEKFARLSDIQPSGKSLWIYLLSGPHTSIIPGVLNTGKAAIAESLNWTIEEVDRHFAEIEKEGMAVADWKTRIVWLPKGVFYNPPENPSVARSWAKEYAVLPECQIRHELGVAINALMVQMDENSARNNRQGGYLNAWHGSQKFSTGGFRSQAKPSNSEPEVTNKPAEVTHGASHGVTHGATHGASETTPNLTQGVTQGVTHGASHGVAHGVTHGASASVSQSHTTEATSTSPAPSKQGAAGSDGGMNKAGGSTPDLAGHHVHDDAEAATHGASHSVTHYRSSNSISSSNSSSNRNSKHLLPEADASGIALGQQADQGQVAIVSEGTVPVSHDEKQTTQSTKAESVDQFSLIPPVADPVFLEIPLVGSVTAPKSYMLLESKVREYETSFPGIDVRQQLRALRQWNIDNVSERKTATGILRHITQWLNKAQNQAASFRGSATVAVAPSSPALLADSAVSPAFLKFWNAYPPGKGDKTEAHAVWGQLYASISPEDFAKLIDGVEGWKRSDDWQKNGGQYIPNPTRFLREERWKAVPSSRHFGLNNRAIHDQEAAFSGKTLREIMNAQGK